MSGFFESLTARARGEAPVVRPRLPGIFESAQGQFEQSEVFATVEVAAPQPTVPAVAPAPEIRVVRETPDRSEAVAVPTPVAERLPPPATPPRAADAPTVTAAPPKAVPQAMETVQLASRDRAPPPVTEPAPTEPRRPWRDDPAPPAMRPVPSPMPLAAAVVRAVPAPTSPALASVPPPRLASRDIVPHVARARPQQPPPPVAPRQEETTVHVSIGRIEVRAAQPAPEARPRERAKPAVMSLDEYLRSRRERR